MKNRCMVLKKEKLFVVSTKLKFLDDQKIQAFEL